MTDTPMMEALSHPDTPRGLVFSLGYRLAPGTGLAFLTSSTAREPYSTSGTFHEQTVDTITFLLDVTAQVSSDARIGKTRRYMTSGRGHRTPKTREIWEGMLGTPLPASTALEVPGSSLQDSVIDLEAWAAVPSGSLPAEIVRVPGRGLLPNAVAVRGDQQLCAAVVQPEPSDRVDAELLSCLQRITEKFAACGASDRDVLKLTVYYRDPRSWPMIEAMIAGRFGEHSPVVTGIVVSNLEAVGGHVQVSGWARCAPGAAADPGSRCGTVDLRQRLCTLTGTAALPIFSGGEAADMYQQLPPSTIEEQTHLAMSNQRKVLESAGATFADVFRSNWYLTDIRDWEAARPIIESYFPGEIPAPIAVEVSRLTAKQGVRIEPDLWAAVPADR